PVEAVLDAPREVTDLEEVQQPLEADVLAALTDGHLHLGPAAPEDELHQRIDLNSLLGHEPLQQVLDSRVRRAQGLLQPLAQRLKVEEVKIEEAIERREVAELLDERGGQGRL